MPTIENPTDARLWCHELQRYLLPGEKVDVTDEEAEAVNTESVFRLATTPATRSEQKRGNKTAEITEPPVRETR